MPIPFAAIPAAIQLATSIGQFAGGLARRVDRPQYEISDSAKQALALSRAKATTPYMPGYSQAKTNIDLATANKIKAAGQYGNAQESLAGIAGQEASMIRNINARNEAFRDKSINEYGSELNRMAQREDMEFKLNKLDPYKDQFQEGRDMTGAGIENLFGGFDKLGQLDNIGAFAGGSSESTYDMDKIKNAIGLLSSFKMPGM